MTQEIKADYCIAGAGIGGILLAYKLASSGKQIVLLEQGPRFTDKDRDNMVERSYETLNDYADYNDEVEPGNVTPHTSAKAENWIVEWQAQRLFGVGGTTLHYEGFMVRPREDDFRVKELYGFGRNWPISYTDLEPWLLKAEHEVGVVGNDDNPYAAKRSGPYPMPAHPFSYFDQEIFSPALTRLDIVGHSVPRAVNSKEYRGRSQCLACRACKFCPSEARYSPDRVHVPLMDKQSNIVILENLSLRRLETNGKGDRITAAHGIHIQDKTSVVIRAQNFVLAMGGIETPRMLMLSADKGDHKAGLGNMGGHLGRRFSDHLNPWVTYDVGRPVGSRLGFETMISDHFRAQKKRKDQPHFMLFGAPAMDWFPVGYEAAQWATKGDTLSLDELRESIPQIATLAAMTELEGEGILELDKTKLDAFGAPVAKISMKLTDWDRRGHAKVAEVSKKIGEAMGAKHISEISQPGLGLGYHPSGATAMADKPDEGVCDKNLRVFGLKNLYLVSNSVFPHMGANPPTLMIVALALRLGHHLEGRAAQ